MSGSMISDDIFTAAKLALDGLSSREQAISRNVANIDTPGYRSQTISFEKAIQIALRRDESMTVRTTHEAHIIPQSQSIALSQRYRPGGSLRADGNNVDVDVELVDLDETVMRYQTVTQLLSERYNLINEITRSK